MTGTGQRATHLPAEPKIDLFFMKTPSERCAALVNDCA
jgi:hypothetical protein